jgi:TolB-like protein/class 3 adenylate cyclase/Flp pilus assembly protein TadD
MTQQRRLAAIVSADLAGYSRLMGEDEGGTLSALKAQRQRIMDPSIATHGGRIVKSTGDGLLLEFPSVVDAVNCVVEMQTALAQHNAELRPERRMDFRMGVNLGDIIIDEDDIFGDGVNIAARLQSIAPPGGVMISQQVFSSVANKVKVAFSDTGLHRLKNIALPVQGYRWSPEAQDLAPRRIPRTARKLWTWATAAVLLLAVAGFAAWQLVIPTSDDRPQGATPAPAMPGAQRISVAVLPFINQSGDPSQEYFSDGLTEDVISALGRFSTLSVMARNAVFPYKGKAAKPADIGRELDVQYLVEASVRRSGERIRVNAQLIEAASGKLLWSQQYEENLSDVFVVQDAISHNVAGALAVSLTKAEQQRVLAKGTDNLDAYDLVLRGRERLWLGTRASNREARQLFDQAKQKDSNYAAAYAWLGRAYLEMADLGWTEDPTVAVKQGLELGKKALSLDPDNVEGLSVVGSAHALRTEYDLALAASDRLLEINPSDARGLLGRLAVLLWLGRIPEAIEAGEQAFRFDPNPPATSVFNLGLAYYEARRHADAIRVLERGVSRFPDNWFLQAALAASYAQLGRMAEAAQALEALRRLNPFFDLAGFGDRFQKPELQTYLQQGIVKAGWQ